MGIRNTANTIKLVKGARVNRVVNNGNEEPDESFLINDLSSNVFNLNSFAFLEYPSELSLDLYNDYLQFKQSDFYNNFTNNNIINSFMSNTESFNPNGRKSSSLHSNTNPVRGDGRPVMEKMIEMGFYTPEKKSGFTNYVPTTKARAFATFYTDFADEQIFDADTLAVGATNYREEPPFTTKIGLGSANSYCRVTQLQGKEILCANDTRQLFRGESLEPTAFVIGPTLKKEDMDAIEKKQDIFKKNYENKVSMESQDIKMKLSRGLRKTLASAKRAFIPAVPLLSSTPSWDSTYTHTFVFETKDGLQNLSVKSNVVRSVADACGVAPENMEFRVNPADIPSNAQTAMLFFYDKTTPEGNRILAGYTFGCKPITTPNLPSNTFRPAYTRHQEETLQRKIAFYNKYGFFKKLI